MEIIENKDSRSGLIGTVLFHLLLLLLFLFIGMNYPDPPPPEEGIAINFGTSSEGMGEVESESTSESANQPENVEAPTPPTNPVVEESVQTQNHTETVEVNSSETETVEEVVEETPPTPSENLSNALDAFNNSQNSSESNEGETNSPGNQGVIDGDPNSPNHSGGGNGNGMTYSLAGRSLVSTPTIKDNSQDQGKVVVDIVVDKFGQVIKATPGGRGSTTTSPILYKKAREAALKTKFNVRQDLIADQKGQMTFVFILN